MKRLFKPSQLILGTAMVSLLFVAAQAWSAEAVFGMVTLLQGQAWYAGAGKKEKEPLSAFMKIYIGDSVTLDAGSTIQLIDFDSGRKETWQGPAVLSIDREKGALAVNSSHQPEVSEMPDVVAREVRRISKIIDPSALQKAGAKIVRGSSDTETEQVAPVALDVSEERELNLARTTYQSLLKQTGASDITPELFLFSVLADYDQYDEMMGLIEVMKQKQPGNPTIDRLTSWVESQR